MTKSCHSDPPNSFVISFRMRERNAEVVISYLHGRTDPMFSQREGKRRGFDALLSFWKPYAWKAYWHGQKVASKQEELQAIARDSVDQLLRHAQRIVDDFDLGLSLGSTSQLTLMNTGPTSGAATSTKNKPTPPQETPSASWITPFSAPTDLAEPTEDAFAIGNVMGDLM